MLPLFSKVSLPPTSLLHYRRKEEKGFYSAFLNAAGRVLYDVFIYPTAKSKLLTDKVEEEGGFLIEVDGREAQALAGHLKKFRLRRRVEIDVLEGAGGGGKDGWGVHAIWDDRKNQSHDYEKTSEAVGASQTGCVDARAPGMGHRVIASPSTDLSAEVVPLENYHLRRILHGVPRRPDRNTQGDRTSA